MLYPILSLKRLDDRDEERHAEELLIAADSIAFVAPLSDGGSRVYSNSIPDEQATGGIEDGEPYVDVTASPKMIATLINSSIASAAKMAALGSIDGQIQANNELAKNASKIAVPIPRMNGG